MPLRRPPRVVLSSLLLLLLAACAGREVKPAPSSRRQAPKVALVLGAGAARGFAHVGVLKVLEANRIPVHMVVGTSVGSLVGSLYAFGYPAYEIQKMAMALERSDVVDLTVPDNGFVQGEKLEAYVNRLVRDTPMEEFRIPFHAVATDIRTGREMVSRQGERGGGGARELLHPGDLPAREDRGRTPTSTAASCPRWRWTRPGGWGRTW